MNHRSRDARITYTLPTGRQLTGPIRSREQPAAALQAVMGFPAPQVCLRCQCQNLSSHPEVCEHVQEDIVLLPRTWVTRFVHQQGWCPRCRRRVYMDKDHDKLFTFLRVPNVEPNTPRRPLPQSALRGNRTVRGVCVERRSRACGGTRYV